MAAVIEQAVFFRCVDSRLLGILHEPDARCSDIGMVLVVGGPQYRVGSHRQFVLLARDVAASGIPVFRFDYRGMGDSEGEFRDFEDVGADIRAAIDTLIAESPGVRRIVLWGLCDAASADAFYATTDPRVVGQIAANPWVRTAEGEAQTIIRHYYLQRLASAAFWRKVLRFDFDVLASARDLLDKLRQTRSTSAAADAASDTRPLPVRLRHAQLNYEGATLLIISGQDLTAQEYLDRVEESPDWKAWFESDDVDVTRLDAADHTFSSAEWRDLVARRTRDWIAELSAPASSNEHL